MKALNLYAGIGGNRKFWTDVDVTAVEIDPQIAEIYQDFFPNDKVVVGDAHKYLLEHYKKFDFIWSSPPCPTHTKLRTLQKAKIYPDMKLYQEVIFLQNWHNKKWVIENVEPYYEPLIKPQKIHRHFFWSNFHIANINFPKMRTCKIEKEREFLQEKIGFNLDKYSGINKRTILRNCVIPELGKHVLECAFYKVKAHDLFTGTEQNLFGAG